MATTINLTETGQHLRDAYLHVVDYNAVNPVDLADEMEINARYARELLATLKTGGLLVITDVEGEDVWQPMSGHPEDLDHDDEVARIDAWLVENGQVEDDEPDPHIVVVDIQPDDGKLVGRAKAKSQPKTQSNPADLPLCKCGCGTPIGRKSRYKPGHDARHAGMVARAIAADPSSRDGHLAILDTDALRRKADGMADRLLAKDAAGSTKSATKPAPKEILGKVKRGKTWYPGKQVDGVLYRNTKKDGTGTWNEADQASEFVPD